MAKNNQTLPTFVQWEVPEYRTPERGKNWYIIAGIIAAFFVFFSLFAFEGWRLVFLGARSNFLFIVIIIISVAVLYFQEQSPAMMVRIKLGPEGINVGKKFHYYKEFKNFSVLYLPKESIKRLYFEFKSSTKMRLSFPLRSLDPSLVRKFLAQYLKEDFERKNEPLSEQLTKLLKL
ncbi:MAG: hypothetical protein ACOX0C_01390 [Patescibacteria group bacterium]|jgi:hypothetical protein